MSKLIVWKKSNYDKIQTLKETQKVEEEKNCDQHQLWQKNIVTKLKVWQSSNCDKTKITRKLKLPPNSNCDKSKKMIKLLLWQNSKCD